MENKSEMRKLPLFSTSLDTNFLVSSFFMFFPQFQNQHTILDYRYSVKIKINEKKVLWLYTVKSCNVVIVFA
jgi:hypothetical protein